MLIHYKGDAGARHLGGYSWTKENGYVVNVKDTQLAADLLTTDEFESVRDAPADADEIKGLASVLGASEQETRNFVRARGRRDKKSSST